jgi:hypothetical protein
MKKIIFSFCFSISIISTQAQDRNWALGLKIGEPLGLNIKKYFREGENSFDLNVGAFGFLWGGERTYRKETIYSEAGLMVQGLWNKNFIKGKNDGINLYYGYGAQFNSRNRPGDLGVRDKFRVVSFGPAINAGLEVGLPENNLSLFLDAGGYGEIAPKPFFFAFNSCIGLRLNLSKN